MWSLLCRTILTSFSSGQHLNKELFPVNSLQRVPTLKDGDFVLSERCAFPLPPPEPTWPLGLSLWALPDPLGTEG